MNNLIKDFIKKLLCIMVVTSFLTGYCYAANDVSLYLENFQKNSSQWALTGSIEKMRIVRDDAMFNLGPGVITVFDFGWDKPSAMVYKGAGVFTYTPPDIVELHQLLKFTDLGKLNHQFNTAVFFFTIPIDELEAQTGLTRQPVSKFDWDQIVIAQTDALEHREMFLPNFLLDGLLSEQRGDFFYADFHLDDIGHLVFRESPAFDDWYRLYDIKRSAGVKTADILGGWSPDDLLPTQRGVMPIDIYHYEINSKIETEGKMTVNCRIHYIPLLPDVKFLYFDWYYKNKVIAAYDSEEKYIHPVYKKEGFKFLDERRQESGLGLVLNKPTVVGDSDYVDIQIDSKSLRKHGTLYYIKSNTGWYPHSRFRDRSTYSLTYNCPGKYKVISCGRMIESVKEGGRLISKFELTQPFDYVTFNVGSFKEKEIIAEGYPPVGVYLANELYAISGTEFENYLSEETPNRDGLTYSDTAHSYLVNVDKLKQAGTDVINSVAFFTSMFGPCPFDSLKVTSVPYYGTGQGSPGVIYLSWDAFFEEDLDGLDEQFRSHEVAHQWWGHLVDKESYRDTWITEGLSDYCGLWFYQLSAQNESAYKKMLKDYRDYIISGTGIGSVGSEAGPIVLGHRLSSTKSKDYTPIVYYKGAYIYHMIRYILHDYQTGSDDRFAAFLKDMTVKFKDEPITTQGLQRLLEGHVGGDMTWFFDQWVYGTFIPEYTFSYETRLMPDGKYKVICKVGQEKVPGDFKMLVPVTVIFEGGRFIHFKVWVNKPTDDIELPPLPYKPKEVIFNTYDAVLCKLK
ncbi:MAG: hypothetical protein GY839_20060 [candidate division Zixibacteria bacterium]|nr:hypothetical protein [candidate division Zixibacteria bacterium]